jgi:peptidoglycan glycosyltransferase
VNHQIRNVAVAAIVLLAALVVGATYWQAWAVGDLQDKQDNAIQLVAQFKIKRGVIYTAGGVPLAVNRARKENGQTFYFRRYPSGSLASDIVGYSTQSRFRTGLERSMNDYLTASNTHLTTVVRRTLDKLEGKTVKGNNLVLTLRPGAQRIAQHALDRNCGAAVALDPHTGKVLVMATSPTYDPNLVEGHFGLIEKRAHGNCASLAPLVNRSTAGLFTPGSSFKILTAAAAIDSGKFTPDSGFYDPGYCVEYRKKVYNFADQSGPEQFGNVTLSTALQHSINAVFCQVGKRLGAITILKYAKRFGFYELPPLETPADQRRPSGLYRRGHLFSPRNGFQVDPGRLAFGQERLLVTPLQMAMVVAGIANSGMVMEPTAVRRIVAPDGRNVSRLKPHRFSRAVSRRTAAALTTAMKAVVTSGTGTAARIPGVPVAGKTGTAETGRSGVNTTSFVAFAPADSPRVAIAVFLEEQHGVGGTTAAPVARTVLEALLRRGRT